MKKTIVITGGTGLIGSRLIQMLDKDMYSIRIYTRKIKKSHENVSYYYWNPSKGEIDFDGLKSCDHIVSLAGAGIADKRWSNSRKKEIIDSRVLSNELLRNSLDKLDHRPKSIIAGSAIGFYGNRGSNMLDEKSEKGSEEFLVNSTILWENSLTNLGVHTNQFCMIRIGIVLSTMGGALQKMMIPLRFGLSAYFGDGKQYYSWIHIDDLCKMLIKGIEDESWVGIFNGTAPNPIPLRQMAKEIKHMFLPLAIAFPVPSLLLKLGMGEMTRMLTNSTRVIPKNAMNQGFEFTFTEVKDAVMDLKNRRI